ncbi:L-threonine 3-dehydrogenase [Steroidobacter agaridevorans]|uniref:L-threonine 3-dehydrogenase n=1 Tax=Steroidobacter agaridevorans TaxID=2695856 RepID=A0A829YNR0_9GAMM|nr:L-threonine 3-dehydrogenase [Steroidobacter agaridevorans]GFE84453.1 L-threonine 3-dehydrogenase [Steroidobacter agaridevorans]
MRALVKAHAAVGIELQDIPKPTVGPNDVMIRVRRTAICGTDMHIYNWDAWAQKTIPVPMAVGHEYSGEVVEVGSEVQGFKPGDRVSGEGHITCGYCRNCRAGRRHLCRNTQGVGVNRQGSFADYVVIPAFNAFKLPAAIDDEIASILDPLGNAVHTALAFDVVGEDVLITGAGPIGIMAAAIVRFIGARNVVITDVNDYRLDLARKMGATLALNVTRDSLDDAMKQLGMQEGFDVGLEMSGNASALRSMLRTLHHGGSVAMLGIPATEVAIDWNEVVFKGLTIKGIYGRQMFETWYKMAAMLQSGLNIRPIITHRLPVAEYQRAFEIMGAGQSGKVVMNWETT